MRRERAADCMRFGHDALKPFFAVSTFGIAKIRHLGASESLKSLAVFQCATHDGFNKSSQLFPISLPLSDILIKMSCAHPVEIQNIVVVSNFPFLTAKTLDCCTVSGSFY